MRRRWKLFFVVTSLGDHFFAKPKFSECSLDRIGLGMAVPLRDCCPDQILIAYSFHPVACFADAVKVAAFFPTNSCTLSGACPVSMRTSSDIRSKRPARCRSPIAARWFTR